MKIHSGLAALALVALTASDGFAQSRRMGSLLGLFTGHIGAVTGGEVSDARMTPGALGIGAGTRRLGRRVRFRPRFGRPVRSRRFSISPPTWLNASWVKPYGSLRPFGSAGAGIVQINGCDSPCNRAATTYDLGFNLGGGVFAVLNDTVGVRGDARYFFASADHPDSAPPDNFGFWRISIGATFMWAIVP